MDSYTEQIVERRAGNGGEKYSKAGVNVVVIAVLLMLFISIYLGFALLGVGIALLFVGKGNRGIEYEYLFVNGDFEVSVIKDKTSRKVAFEMKESEVTKIWPYDLPKAKNELEVNKKLTIKDYTSGKKDDTSNWYIFFVNGNNTTNAVILELDEKNVEHVKTYYKKKLETK